VPQVKESADSVRTVVAQTPPAGVDLGSASVTAVTKHQYDTGFIPTTDNATVGIVDRDRVLDAGYKLGYKPNDTGTEMKWYIVRTVGTKVDTVVNNETHYLGDAQYPIFDGVQLNVSGAPLGQLLAVNYVGAGSNPPGLKGESDIGGAFFDGSADYAANILPMGSAIDP